MARSALIIPGQALHFGVITTNGSWVNVCSSNGPIHVNTTRVVRSVTCRRCRATHAWRVAAVILGLESEDITRDMPLV